MGRAHVEPLQQVSGRRGLHLTSHTHKTEGRSIVRETFRLNPRLTLPESVPKYPVSPNKRTTIRQEVIRDTSGLKIDSLLTNGGLSLHPN